MWHKKALLIGLVGIGLAGCKPTYKKETLKESVREMARREYKLDVEVKETGRTLGVRYRVPNLIGELVAEDQRIWKQVDDLMLVLSRITLSADVAPDFFVLEIVDADHPSTVLVFTRYVSDVKKLMAEGLSRNQYSDRLLIEMEVGGKRITFDPYEMDLVRLMMMTIETQDGDAQGFELTDVDFREFLAKVAANYMRRMFREKKDMQTNFQIRQVTGAYQDTAMKDGTFRILLDLVSQPSARLTPNLLELQVLPKVAEEVAKIFNSYKFSDFSSITVVEKNSGKFLTVPGRPGR